MKKERGEFENFDDTMRHLLAVPYSELQKKLEEEKHDKAKHSKHKKRRATSSPVSRVSSVRKKRVV